MSSRPRSLWWAYLLVVVALGGLGVGAAQALAAAYDLGGVGPAEVCLQQHGLSDSTFALATTTAAQASQFSACTAASNYRNGVVMLVGMAALPIVAWLLMLGGGLAMRWRLRRGRREVASTSAVMAALDRFAALCDGGMLTGRRRPRLLLASPGTSTGPAFTTGFPFGRPLIVVPLGYAYLEPAEFDVVVLHELAHVRSRDVVWASLVWWAGWLSVPALLIAVVPYLGQPRALDLLYGTSLGTAVVLSAVVLLLRAALLRRRELAADRYAVEVMGDGAAALRAALGRDSSGEPVPVLVRVLRRARQFIALHPSMAARRAADPAAVDRWEGGFVFTAVAGLIAMVVLQGVFYEVDDLAGYIADPALSSDVASGVSSLLWALVVIPAWTRRAEVAHSVGSRPTWWGPLAGAIVGLVGGYNLQIPGTSESTSAVLSGHLSLVLPSLALVTAGVSVMAAALATRLAGQRRSPGLRLLGPAGAVLAVAAALTTAWSVTLDAVEGFVMFGSTASVRLEINTFGGVGAWRFTPSAVLVGFVIVVWSTRPRGRRLPWASLPPTAVAIVVGGVAAAVSLQLRKHADSSMDTAVQVVFQRWWICAIAGWVVAVAIGWAGGRHLARVPTALSAGLVTAALAGLLQFSIVAVAGTGRNLRTFEDSLREPMWLLFAMSVATLPLLLLAAALVGRIRRHPMPAFRARYPTVGVGLVVGLLALALVGGLLSPVTVASHDYSQDLAASGQRASAPAGPTMPHPSPPPAPDPHHAVDPGRPLDQAAITAAIAKVPSLLPADAKVTADSSSGAPQDITPTACLDALNHDAAVQNALPTSAGIIRKYSFREGQTQSGVSLTITVNSLVTPKRDFTDVRHWDAACAHFHFRIPNDYSDSGYDATFSEGAPPVLPYPAYRTDFTAVDTVHHLLGINKTSTDWVLIGHNEITVGVKYDYAESLPTPLQQDMDQLLTDTLTTIINGLRSPP